MKQARCPNLAVCPNIPDFTLEVTPKTVTVQLQPNVL